MKDAICLSSFSNLNFHAFHLKKVELTRRRKFSGKQYKDMIIECLHLGSISLIVVPWKFDSISVAIEASFLATERHFNELLCQAYCFSPTTLYSANLEKFRRSTHYEPLCFLYIFRQFLVSFIDGYFSTCAHIFSYCSFHAP